MKFIFWGKGERGAACLQKLAEEQYRPDLVIVHPEQPNCLVREKAQELRIEFIAPEDPNHDEVLSQLILLRPDFFILGGYGKILKKKLLQIPKIFSLNLHGGKVPQYRGSSPLNWALIKGETKIYLSILKVDEGIDSGELLQEASFEVNENQTIKDLHDKANHLFPKLLLDTLEEIKSDRLKAQTQDSSKARYFPRRFPSDGLVLFDQMSAGEIHNTIRALTRPYPCAFGYFQGRKVYFISSKKTETPFYGEPGRVYRRNGQKILVGAKDQCLWLTEVVDENGKNVTSEIKIYDQLLTIKNSLIQGVVSGLHNC